jgi:hypothetical protein
MGGGIDRYDEAGSLHQLVDDDPGDRLRRFAATDRSDRAHPRHLFRHRVLQTEASESSAQRLERGDHPHQAPPRGFVGEIAAIGQAGTRDRRNQRVIVKVGRQGRRSLCRYRHNDGGGLPYRGEQIELAIG